MRFEKIRLYLLAFLRVNLLFEERRLEKVDNFSGQGKCNEKLN